MSTEPSRSSLPFEPRHKSKKNSKKPSDSQPSKTASPQNSSAKAVKESTQKSQKNTKTQSQSESGKTKHKKNSSSRTSQESMPIPDVVSKRMVRRMALLCGIPSTLAMATFVVSYFLVTKMGLELPHIAVVLVSIGFFGLGALGLSYGLFSASWDEDLPGSILGWREFTINLKRTTSAWRSAREAAKQKD